MLVPLSWLLEYAPLREPVDEGEVARRLTGVGLEIEALERVGQDIAGIVVARVLEIEELTGFKKPVRFCKVTTGGADGEPRYRMLESVRAYGLERLAEAGEDEATRGAFARYYLEFAE